MLVQGSCAIVTTTKREIMQTLSQTIQTTGNLTLILIWKKKCLISFFAPRVLFEFNMINNINIWELVKKKKKDSMNKLEFTLQILSPLGGLTLKLLWQKKCVMFHLAKLLQPCSWGLNWSWYSPGRRHCWHLRLMVNEIYIFIYTHTQVGDTKRGCQGIGSFWLSMKVKEKSPHGSAWVWNQNMPFLSVSWHADGQQTTCKEEEKDLWGLCNMLFVKQNKPANHNQERKEGEGVHALPQGNVIAMLGSQLTVSGWARASLPLSFGLLQCHAPSYTVHEGEGYF